VYSILGPDGKVVNGKGEGMYIGALLAYQLNTPRWIIYYDADNFVPSALLEYTLAMSRLFMSSPLSRFSLQEDTLMVGNPVGLWAVPDLHNVRICWSSKPDMGKPDLSNRILGRTTKVVSPLFTELIAGWFGILDHSIFSSNSGEQGMTMSTAATLRFSSGFSVETFHLLDLLFHAHMYGERAENIVLQQYLSQSPHFHEKKDDEHIKQMIEESLGCFDYFKKWLPANVSEMLDRLYTELDLSFRLPKVYPPLNDLPARTLQEFAVERYKLTAEVGSSGLQEMLIAE
jgi:mannosyl-3-phosphoglycerate synthase